MTSIYTIYERYTGRVVLETDDWVEAEVRSGVKYWPSSREPLSTRGTHPTHEWGPPHKGQGDRSPRCRKCGAWDNTSFSAVAPCGYDGGGAAIATILEREMAAREPA